MDRPSQYLQIPEDYCRSLGGLRWSADAEAVESDDGRTFAFSAAVMAFIEGFAAQRPLIHFGHILHLLRLLGGMWCTPGGPGEAYRLSAAFRTSGKNYRNAGAFFGAVCGDAPAVAEPPLAVALSQCVVLRVLGRVLDVSASQPPTAETPSLSPAAFEARVLRATAAFTDDALRHWFRHGRGPVAEAAAAVADAVRRAPRTLEDALTDAARRQRLAGAAPFVEQLTSALTLPPRRLAPPELPLGGYADVTTRGGPEQILPSQFALDDLEFVRRCAERELLYYRREEPQDRTREDLVVLLDQGVRTWGDVRLVLSAAVFALGRLAGARRLPFRVAATGKDGVVYDPLEMTEDAFAALLEPSDLTADPGLALEKVLEEETDAARDVVLLTHPRNLGEPGVQAAARRVRPGSRLFAVAVDGRGDVEFSEVRRGAPVRLSRFHVDLTRTAPPPPVRPAAPPRGTWSGDVEPVGFPFVFGPAYHEPFHFDFDFAGEWLVTATARGMLHATRTDGSRIEVLPRAVVDGRLLADVHRVIGIAGGVVVVGVSSGDVAVVAHYDFGRRTCSTHLLGPLHRHPCNWYYFRDLHSVVLANRHTCRAVDLATGGRLLSARFVDDRTSRAKDACDRVQRLAAMPIGTAHPDRESLHVEHWSGKVILERAHLPWEHFVPLSDGRPMLQGATFVDGQWRGWTLALTVHDEKRQFRLCLFRGPEGTPLASYVQNPSLVRFTLSGDGRLLARQIASCRLEVRDALAGGPPLCSTPVGGFHKTTAATIGDRWLLVRARRNAYLIRWDQGRLLVSHTRGSTTALVEEARRAGLEVKGVEAQKAPAPGFLGYDPGRFHRTAYGGLTVVVDAFGQTAVFETNGNLVCMFFVYGGQLAGWAPPDVYFGPANLLGGPPTQGADVKIGRALLDAWDRREARTP